MYTLCRCDLIQGGNPRWCRNQGKPLKIVSQITGFLTFLYSLTASTFLKIDHYYSSFKCKMKKCGLNSCHIIIYERFQGVDVLVNSHRLLDI